MDNGTYAVLAGELYILLIISVFIAIAGAVVGCIIYGVTRLRTFSQS
jgi:hypothetical protein